MTKNEEVINCFVCSDKQARTENIFIEKNVLYDYGYHFPLAIKLKDGVFILNSDGYSVTTSRHKNLLKRYVGNGNNVLFTNTSKLKGLISRDIQSVGELIVGEL